MSYIVPVISKQITDSIQQKWLFLERNGTHLIHLGGADPMEFLAVNDMVAASPPVVVGELVIVEIDTVKTDLSCFYTWKEAPPGSASKEVWRPFLWTDDSLGVNRCMTEVSLGPHTALAVLTSIEARKTLP